MVVRETLGANLKEAILRNYPDMAISTAELQIEKATGISQSTLQRIRNKQVSAETDTLATIAHHLGITVDALFVPAQSKAKRNTGT